MHQSSLENMKKFREKYLRGREGQRLLVFDLGSFDINGSYKPFFDEPGWTYRGLDLQHGPNVDVVLRDPYIFKGIGSGTADVFISGQAFEHIEFFWLSMLEIGRVLKTGGICCIIAPSGGYEHRYPVDCWRFYADGFVALCKFARLELREVYVSHGGEGRYTDESDIWKDAVLVCEKPIWSWRTRVGLVLMKWLLNRWVGMRGPGSIAGRR